ncbi:MAG TPA: heme-binding protein [Beijerinckiaceae bacterium]|jgi:uncharacterized protein GlcG (DUF336 family)|nr:heme-binding protein [Beijerinckiaceae bacterium]
MTELTLSAAQKIVADALAHSRSHNFNPMGVVVLDDRGALKAAAMEDGTSLIRWKIAFGKAFGAVSWGAGSRKVAAAAVDRPHFFTAVAHLADGGIVPVAGGVLIRDAAKRIIGAVGVSGDTSDHDEQAAIAAINAAGFVADGG